MTEFLDERELYTFYDFVVDRKILANTDTYMQHAKVLYDIHGDDYLQYCKSSDYEPEAMPWNL